MEEYEIQYLTKAGRRWVLHGTVPDDEAVEVDQAIGLGLPRFDGNKSKLMREAVKNASLEPVYQRRVELALDILDGAYDLDDLDSVKETKMALTGCLTETATEFTGELSREYKERYGDE